jgi:hypothetical protein
VVLEVLHQRPVRVSDTGAASCWAAKGSATNLGAAGDAGRDGGIEVREDHGDRSLPGRLSTIEEGRVEVEDPRADVRLR